MTTITSLTRADSLMPMTSKRRHEATMSMAGTLMIADDLSECREVDLVLLQELLDRRERRPAVPHVELVGDGVGDLDHHACPATT